MPTPDQILMRKIRKREKAKLKFITKKPNDITDNFTEVNNVTSIEVEKRSHESNGYIAIKPKKKKQKVKIVDEESTEVEKEASNSNDSKDKQPDEIQDNAEEIHLLDSNMGILSDRKFSSLEGIVCEPTLRSINEMGFTTMTEVQAKTIPPLLNGRHLFSVSRTGSGKTLAFLIPAIDLMYKLKFKPRNGTGVIILSPTRELAIQTFGVLTELMKYHHQTYGLVMGGANRTREAKKLYNGINILVATPGRLLDHLQNTPDFIYKCVFSLIIDEADRMLEIGFEEEVKQIFNILPAINRQRVLFSATKTEKTEALAAFIFNERYMYVGIDDHREQATVDSLQQGFFVCPAEKRLSVLFSFLRRAPKKMKAMVFFSSCMSVIYHHKLFNYIDLSAMCIHGKQEQAKRTTTYFQFCNAESGILLCTDVAARGLDIPAVDWIIQYDPPDNPKEYIHRVGRTARGLDTSGRALMFLHPEEMGFLGYLKQAKVTLNEYKFNWDKFFDIQPQLGTLLSRNYALKKSAKEAYKSYIRAYESHQLKTVFNINKIDLAKVSKSFGFSVPPIIDQKMTNKAHLQKRKGGGGGYKPFNSSKSLTKLKG